MNLNVNQINYRLIKDFTIALGKNPLILTEKILISSERLEEFQLNFQERYEL